MSRREWHRFAVFLTAAASVCLSWADGSLAAPAEAVRRYDQFQAVAGNGRLMVAVSAFGVVEVSADGGATWSRQELAGAPGLIKVAACGDGSFAALEIDGAVWLAGVEATGWTRVALPAQDAVLDLACTADGHLWVVGARGAILSSADRGAHWSDQSLPDDVQLLNVQFPRGSAGVISGEFGRVLLTADGGAHWREGGSLGPDFYPQAMDFADERHGLVVGLGGAVLATEDGGATWTRGKAPTEAPLYGVVAAGPGGPLAVGAAGALFSRAGAGWMPVRDIPLADFRGVIRVGSGALLAGTGMLLPVGAEQLSAASK